MDISQSPNLPEPEAVHAIVVYHPKTGAILHRHLAVRYPGGRVLEGPELEKRALDLTTARGITTKGLRLLHVDPAVFSEEVECRVDVKHQRPLTGRRKPLTHADLMRRSRGTSK
jgi:hypothetical protein